MSKKLHLTLACGDYEIVRALMDGSVKPDGIELTVLTDMTSDIRHWRMVRNREFDVAELSMSNYLAAEFRSPGSAMPSRNRRKFSVAIPGPTVLQRTTAKTSTPSWSTPASRDSLGARWRWRICLPQPTATKLGGFWI